MLTTVSTSVKIEIDRERQITRRDCNSRFYLSLNYFSNAPDPTRTNRTVPGHADPILTSQSANSALNFFETSLRTFDPHFAMIGHLHGRTNRYLQSETSHVECSPSGDQCDCPYQ